MNIGKEDFYFSILEQKIENKFLFPIKININGLCFGTFDSPTYMPSFIASLKSLIENKYLLNNELNKIKDVFAWITIDLNTRQMLTYSLHESSCNRVKINV